MSPKIFEICDKKFAHFGVFWGIINDHYEDFLKVF